MLPGVITEGLYLNWLANKGQVSKEELKAGQSNNGKKNQQNKPQKSKGKDTKKISSGSWNILLTVRQTNIWAHKL